MQLAGVLLEVEISTESFAASCTRERLAIFVGVHVERQIIDLMKRLGTDLNTNEISLPSMPIQSSCLIRTTKSVLITEERRQDRG